MKKIFKTKHFISALTIFTLLFSAMLFEASAVDKNEVESNNTSSNATVTYDDYDNYGKISTAGDVDWWQITFTSTGYANFWLGEIPSGCVYYLELYEFDGLWKLAESKRAVSNQQLIRAKVYNGVNYKVKIYSYSGYSASANYKFRIKNYTTTARARIYTTPAFVDNGPIVKAYTQSMGLETIHRQDYTATNVFNQIDDMNLAVICASGAAGRVDMNSNTHLVANTVTNDQAGYKGIGNHSSVTAMEDMWLICFQSPYSGITSNTYGNLVDKAREKNAMCCLGWKQNVTSAKFEEWNDLFFGYLEGGSDVLSAMEDTKTAINGDNMDQDVVTDIYFGTSQLSALTLS